MVSMVRWMVFVVRGSPWSPWPLRPAPSPPAHSARGGRVARGTQTPTQTPPGAPHTGRAAAQTPHGGGGGRARRARHSARRAASAHTASSVQGAADPARPRRATIMHTRYTLHCVRVSHGTCTLALHLQGVGRARSLLRLQLGCQQLASSAGQWHIMCAAPPERSLGTRQRCAMCVRVHALQVSTTSGPEAHMCDDADRGGFGPPIPSILLLAKCSRERVSSCALPA
jgi:hypothetical protein